MAGEIVLAMLVIAFVGWLARPAFRNIRTGRYRRQDSGGPGAMPPSGPDIGGGVGPT